MLKGTNLAIFFVATRVMLFASFMVHIFIGGSLDAETVFVTMSLFNAIRIPVTNQFPQAVGIGAETLVSMERVQALLMLEEKTESTKTTDHVHGTIVFNKFNGKWNRVSASLDSQLVI